jgi:TonB family protein
MQAFFNFSTNTFLIATTIAVLFLLGLILTFRFILSKKSQTGYQANATLNGSKNPLEQRNKYPAADIFKYSQQFLLLGLIMTLMMCVFAFNWTTFEKKVNIPDNALVLEEDIELAPPRSAVPPPPPPPPPPPVIEEVPTELMEEDDDVEFLDQSIDEKTELEIIKAPEVKKTKAAPPPPPPPPPAEEEIFVVVEQMPRFPGCENEPDVAARKSCSDQKLIEFIYQNIEYPSIAKENHIEGTVVLKFVIDEKGRVDNIVILKDIGANCGKEAERVIKLMNEQNIRWEPGKQRGRPVKVWFMLPVRFKLV